MRIRRVGKTTFLKRELIPRLQRRGARVIYVDLWADTSKRPRALVHEAVRVALRTLEPAASGVGRRVKGVNLSALGFGLGARLDAVGTPGGPTLAEAFAALVQRTRSDVVLVVDEVQQAMSPDGSELMHALKAARDRVNTDPDMPGHFLFFGTGSHRSFVNGMAALPSHPFKRAVTVEFERLPREFVAWKLDRLRADPRLLLPSLDAAWEGFRTVGHRPEDFDKALRGFQQVADASDASFRIICATLASVAADAELARASELAGHLGEAVFARIAGGPDAGVKEVHAAAALADCTRAVGVEVEAKQVQNVIDKLIAANLIARIGHGKFVVSDPFVKQAWRARQDFDQAFGEAAQARRVGPK